MPAPYICPRCGAPIQSGQRFCAHCALPLDPQSLAAFTTTPRPVPAAPRSGGVRWGLVGGLVGLVLVACVAITVVSASLRGTVTPTPVPISAPTIARLAIQLATLTAGRAAATATALPLSPTLPFDQAHATAQVLRDTQDRAAATANAAPAGRTALAQAQATTNAQAAAMATAYTQASTATAVAAHAAAVATERAQPTAPPLPGFGSTQTLKTWTISLAKLSAPRKQLTWSEFGNTLLCNGNCYLVYIDARNGDNQTRAIGNDFKFRLHDDHAATYGELTESDPYAAEQFAQLQGRDPVDIGVVPRKVTHPLLVFDIAEDALPASLTIQEDMLFGGGDEITFQLHK